MTQHNQTSSQHPTPAPTTNQPTSGPQTPDRDGAAGTHLVLGGTGKTGRRVAARLAASGARVRVGSRSGTPPFDWRDRATWEPALAGAHTAYLAYAPDVSAPEAAEDLGAFAKLAAARGVRRLVLLSGRGMPGAHPAEDAVRAAAEAAGAAWTVLRGSWFCQNFSEDFLLEGVRRGEFVLPVGDGGQVAEPFVDLDDLADVAVAALTGDGHAGRVYELSCARSLTFHEAAAELSEAIGREVRFRPLSPEQYAAALAEAGLPPELVGLLAELFPAVLDGRNARPVDGVREALGRPPRTFAAFARDAAASGVWDVGR